MKAGSLIALADACGVGIEWLATGNGVMNPAVPSQRPSTIHTTVTQLEHAPLFATLDMGRLGDAVTAAVAAFTAQNKRPTARQLGQVTALIYDMGDLPEADRAELMALTTPSQK